MNQPTTPAMTPADIAAHQAASHVRTAPLNTVARQALHRLEQALTRQAAGR
jgi:hypothetical protein